MRRSRPSFRQRGAVAVLVALLMIFVFIGFVGIVFDLGRLFINMTELQNAVDACALAAAREMNAPDEGKKFLERAENAGIFVGNKHLHDFQLTPVALIPSDVTFSEDLNGVYRVRADATASVRYVRCTKRIAGFAQWFPQLLWQGGSTVISPVGATAVAWLGGSSSVCAIPMAMCTQLQTGVPCPVPTPAPPGPPPVTDSLGLCKGQWYSGDLASEKITGSFGWIDFVAHPGGTPDIAKALAGPGVCEVDADAPIEHAEAGSKEALVGPWNSRFGLYWKGGDKQLNVSNAPPDVTGFAYGSLWQKPSNANGNAYPDYLAKRATPTLYQGDSAVGPEIDTKKYADSLEDHARGISDRRLVVMPAVDCLGFANKKQADLAGWACALMVQPMNAGDKPRPTTLEYLGKVGDPGVPCATYGLGGGSGPPVPTLVK